MCEFIRRHTANLGKARFYLKNNAYWVEIDKSICQVVLNEVSRLLTVRKMAITLGQLLVEVENTTNTEMVVNPALKNLITSQLPVEFLSKE
jgi:hypothetical protein